jgi:glycosyltransferase involved in cell wall biosynthesis
MDVKDDAVEKLFEEVLKAIRPDVVQLHSIQALGVSLGSICKAQGIPHAITLHDAWWLCERQFMVTGENKYCFQTQIDPKVCAQCVPDKKYNEYRTALVKSALVEADGIISPSAYFKELHIQNGIPGERIFVNKNGIKFPSPARQRGRNDHVRFGYVGGSSPVKGYELVRDAFSQLPAANVELIMVDNTLNQGYSSVDTNGMTSRNPVSIIPAYSQDSIDEFFAQIDVLLFPSQWKESFGLTVREALARDVWVISSDAGGAIEDIVPGENGDIIPLSTNSDYLKQAMEKAIANREFLIDYKNPYKSKIQYFDDQATELLAHLLALAESKHPNSRST